MIYYPSMPEKPNPSPLGQKTKRPAVRPKPETIIRLDDACRKIFQDTQPEEIARRNDALRVRRMAKAAKPAQTVVMVAREFSPLGNNPHLKAQVDDILDAITELGPEEASRRILEAVALPFRVRLMEMSDNYRHQLSEIEERYNANAG